MQDRKGFLVGDQHCYTKHEVCLLMNLNLAVQVPTRSSKKLALGVLPCQVAVKPQLESNLPLSKPMLQ